MKHTFWIVMVGLLVGIQSVAQAEMKAGYINSRSREVLAKFEDGHRSASLYNRGRELNWGKRTDAKSQLWVVDFRGQSRSSASTFVDRNGLKVSVPDGKYDKIVVLDRYGAIRMGISLSESEALNLVPREDLNAARLVINAQSRPFFGAVRYASPVLERMKGQVETVLDTFASSMRWMGGADVEKFVRVILNKSYFRQPTAVTIRISGQLNLASSKTIFPGVGLISQGGNGGGGDSLVAQGGNGGGGDSLVNPIAQGGNGGGGDSLVNPIAQGGNGGGGDSLTNPMARWEKTKATDVSLQGGIVSLDIPSFSGLNAVTQGSVIVLQ